MRLYIVLYVEKTFLLLSLEYVDKVELEDIGCVKIVKIIIKLLIRVRIRIILEN